MIQKDDSQKPQWWSIKWYQRTRGGGMEGGGLYDAVWASCYQRWSQTLQGVLCVFLLQYVGKHHLFSPTSMSHFFCKLFHSNLFWGSLGITLNLITTQDWDWHDFPVGNSKLQSNWDLSSLTLLFTLWITDYQFYFQVIYSSNDIVAENRLFTSCKHHRNLKTLKERRY